MQMNQSFRVSSLTYLSKVPEQLFSLLEQMMQGKKDPNLKYFIVGRTGRNSTDYFSNTQKQL